MLRLNKVPHTFFKEVCFIIAGFSMTCCQQMPADSFSSCRQTLRQHDSTESEWIGCFKQLQGDKNTPVDLWTGIVLNKQFDPVRRRRALFQLFEGYVRPGASLSSAGVTIDARAWLLPDHLYVLEFLGGSIPVSVNLSDTIVVIKPKFSVTDFSSIYLRINGKINAAEALRGLRGERPLSARIEEIGLSSDDSSDKTLFTQTGDSPKFVTP